MAVEVFVPFSTAININSIANVSSASLTALKGGGNILLFSNFGDVNLCVSIGNASIVAENTSIAPDAPYKSIVITAGAVIALQLPMDNINVTHVTAIRADAADTTLGYLQVLQGQYGA
jgi:hypothetical protein